MSKPKYSVLLTQRHLAPASFPAVQGGAGKIYGRAPYNPKTGRHEFRMSGEDYEKAYTDLQAGLPRKGCHWLPIFVVNEDAETSDNSDSKYSGLESGTTEANGQEVPNPAEVVPATEVPTATIGDAPVTPSVVETPASTVPITYDELLAEAKRLGLSYPQKPKRAVLEADLAAAREKAAPPIVERISQPDTTETPTA